MVQVSQVEMEIELELDSMEGRKEQTMSIEKIIDRETQAQENAWNGQHSAR